MCVLKIYEKTFPDSGKCREAEKEKRSGLYDQESELLEVAMN